jgi:peptide deformylase
MRAFKIVLYPDPILRKVAAPVTVFDQRIDSVSKRMIATMYQSKGIGLAGPQVNLPQRIFVLDASEQRNQPRVMVNPEIRESSGSVTMEEGCLSVPGVRVPVPRAAQIRVRAQDERGKFFELTATELEAVAVQHEIDHLNGVLILDYLSVGVEPVVAKEKPSRLATR